ncbi:MAG: dethiobiotin synthase [Nitrospira sp.]
MNRGLFITGTDTGVGKTVVSAALVRRLVQMRCSVGVMKPVETGVQSNLLDESDAGRLMAAAGVKDSLELVCPYRFRAPLAPIAAACAEGRCVDMQNILQLYTQLAERYAFMVVEGAGGLLVPTGQNWSMRDLIVQLGLPVVLVGRAGLGGINHALLTLESLGREGIVVTGLVLNETAGSRTPAEREQITSTVSLLQKRAGVPVLGPLPYQPHFDGDWFGTIELLARSGPIMDLADLVWRATAESSG